MASNVVFGRRSPQMVQPDPKPAPSPGDGMIPRELDSDPRSNRNPKTQSVSLVRKMKKPATPGYSA